MVSPFYKTRSVTIDNSVTNIRLVTKLFIHNTSPVRKLGTVIAQQQARYYQGDEEERLLRGAGVELFTISFTDNLTLTSFVPNRTKGFPASLRIWGDYLETKS